MNALSQDALIALVAANIAAWVREEMDANSDDVPEAQRMAEHGEGFMAALGNAPMAETAEEQK